MAPAVDVQVSLLHATSLLARMFATDVWLLIVASALALLATKVLVHTQFSLAVLIQTVIGVMGSDCTR